VPPTETTIWVRNDPLGQQRRRRRRPVAPGTADRSPRSETMRPRIINWQHLRLRTRDFCGVDDHRQGTKGLRIWMRSHNLSRFIATCRWLGTCLLRVTETFRRESANASTILLYDGP
jgi:hypothetical protein